MRKNGSGIFYGWYIVAAGMLVLAATIGMVNNCFGLYIAPVCEEMGFTRQQMSMNQTIINLGSAITMMIFGPIYKFFAMRRAYKKVMCLCAIVMCASYFMFSVASALWQFYLMSGIIAFSQTLIALTPFSIIINNWFHSRRGLATGIAFMGTGLGGMIFNLVGGKLIEAAKWRMTFSIFAAIMAAILIPCIFIIIKIEPADAGLAPYGEGEGSSNEEKMYGPDMSCIIKRPSFYMALLSIIVVAIGLNDISASITPHISEVYDDQFFGAAMASAYMASLAAGKLAVGALIDKLGLRLTTIFAGLMLAAALCLLSVAQYTAALVIFVVIVGVSCAYSTVSVPILARGMFGTRSFGSVTGIFMASQAFGSAVAPTLCGMVYDGLNSYVPVYLGSAAALVVIIIPFSFIISSRRLERPQG